MRYKIVIPGRPVPKGRPRFSKGHAYTPEKTRMYEELVGWKAKQVIKSPLRKNIAVYITIYASSKIQGDLDNYAKSILDGMNGVAYIDDKQICSLSIQRISDKEERVEIEIEEMLV
jgi:crossover junction endodeoxyribonuclease RusA